MAEDLFADSELKSRERQGSRQAKAPARPLGVSHGQALRSWEGLNTHQLYKAELAGQLHGLHIGNRVWYSIAELVACFGEPTRDPSPNRVKNGESVKGPQVTIPQLELPLVA